ncbi:MAG: orotidine-5'-phosphate decarboxylase [Gammaproteobacteria bacterium]|nr:orotidine-5'-phosphate decarboxylase [Gammaproteobacteria bacterium]
MPKSDQGSRLIVALDFDDPEVAFKMARQLKPTGCRIKVGLELYLSGGSELVRRLVDDGFDVFLDLKFHDIPNTVARACAVAARLGVWMMNVHGLGGKKMMRAACDAMEALDRVPLLTAVTMLTSHAEEELSQLGLKDTGIQQHVGQLADLAKNSGLDGVVCSAHEASDLRERLGPEFLLVTPGIRPAGVPMNDQRRAVTPEEAVEFGADYLVVGRPVIQSVTPMSTVRDIQRAIGEY